MLARAALALLAAALLAPAATAATAATINASVRITDAAYTPPVVQIEAGERVIWFNAGKRDHTVTSDSGTQISSGAIRPGGELSILFEKAGTYAYHSQFLRDHMHGTVVVTGTAPPQAVSTVTVTVPRRYPIATLSQDALGNLTTSRLLVRLGGDENDDTGQEIGLVVAAGVTAAAVIIGLVWLRRRFAGPV